MRWVVDDRAGLPNEFIGTFFSEILGVLKSIDECDLKEVESISTLCVYCPSSGEELPLEVTYIFTKYEITAVIEKRGAFA